MKKEVITKNAPSAIGPYSQAIKFNNEIYVSGQIPVDPITEEVVNNDIETQTKRVFENIKAILKEEDYTMNDIIKTTVLMTNLEDFTKMNEIYKMYFEMPFPARACYEVKRLPKDVLIEIEVIAKK